MGSAQATTGEPPKGPSLDQQVGQMLKDATPQPADAGAGENAPDAGGVGGGASLDEQVGVALAQAKTGEDLDEQLAAAAAKAIDDEFADPATLADALPTPKPAPTPTPEPEQQATEPAAVKTEPAAADPSPTPAPTPEPTAAPTPAPAPAPAAAAAPAPASAAAPEAAKKPEPVPPAPVPVAKPAAAAAVDVSAPATEATPKVGLAKRLKSAGYAAFIAFSGVFEPVAIKLGAMSTQARHTIAWAALVTLFNAAVVWGVVLLKSPPGFGPPRGEQPMLVGPDGKPTIEPPKHAEPVEEKHASEGAKDEGHEKPSGGGH
ncbi:MAG: hypothetical protein IBJ18_08825 [Phycisphaerales bacterium]|nr:hypothetical protein [Phycisphaerales bacterium]